MLPQKFIDRFSIIFPEAKDLSQIFAEKLPVFRINSLKTDLDFVVTKLKIDGFDLEGVPWSDLAFILKNKTKRDLLNHELCKTHLIYVQSLASQIPPLVLDPRPGEKVLDLTAAPGSKTSQIAALMKCQGELIANDVSRTRFFKLKNILQNLGVNSCNPRFLSLRMEDGSRLCRESPEFFDRILLDAPCSGEARFRINDPKSVGFWNEKKIKSLAQKQRRLILSAWGALKPGGTLVYSTCTFAPEENEVLISNFLKKVGDQAKVEKVELSNLQTIKVLEEWKGKLISTEVKNCIRIKPSNTIEGFFVVKINKIK